ncbi:VPS10 domain-containing receptor SorCS2 [Trichoplax sp. H2]|nr:VPS10 domain-containing receptor SorCS2 [Trichoplax sp. H2]|eukprot:RDD42709.1 VPS10 domain-containing receptor SorCS2 [Trichoplax sp. H2]
MNKRFNIAVVILALSSCVDMEVNTGQELETTEIQLNRSKWLQKSSNSIKRRTRSVEKSKLDNLTKIIESFDIDQLVTITKLNQSGPSISIYYTGERHNIIVILSKKYNSRLSPFRNRIFRSEDRGLSYDVIKPPERCRKLRKLYRNPHNGSKIIITCSHCRIILLSHNSAKTFTAVIKVPFNPVKLIFHPSPQYSTWLLGCDSRRKKLYISKNFGFSWNLIDTGVNRYFWGVPKVDIDPAIIYYEKASSKLTSNIYKYIIRTSTSILWQPSLTSILADSLIVKEKYVIALKKNGNNVRLYVSYDRKLFNLATLPSEMLLQGITVLDTSEDVITLAGHHSLYKSTHLYISNREGTHFHLSLSNLNVKIRSVNNHRIAFYKVHSQGGTYFANQNGENGIVTKITFNKGVTWQLINPPKNSFNGHCQDCQLPNCSLHIQLKRTSKLLIIRDIITSATVPGLILAAGNCGKSLNSLEQVLVISQDGGHTWKISSDYHYSYALLDYGSVIATSKSSLAYNRNGISILYSCNNGNQWHRLKIKNVTSVATFVVDNPDYQSLVLNMLSCNFSQHSIWSAITLDFSKIMRRYCNTNDYYTWKSGSYTRSNQHHCILGQIKSYRLRKNTSCCVHRAGYQGLLSTTACSCTQDDFTCNFGFRRINSNNSQNNYTCSVYPTSFNNNIKCNQTLPSIQLYRKLPADQCKKGIENKLLQVKYYRCEQPNDQINISHLKIATSSESSTSTSINISSTYRIISNKNLALMLVTTLLITFAIAVFVLSIFFCNVSTRLYNLRYHYSNGDSNDNQRLVNW